MEKRLCGHWNLARELNCSTVSYFPGKTTLVHWRALQANFLFIILGLTPCSPHPLAKKAHFPPLCSNFNLIWGGEGGRGRSLVLLLSQELGFNTLNLHCSYSKAIQLSFSYCSNRCLLHIIGCLSSFLLQILSGMCMEPMVIGHEWFGAEGRGRRGSKWSMRRAGMVQMGSEDWMGVGVDRNGHRSWMGE